MMSPPGQLTALACQWTKNLNKAEELTYFSINNGLFAANKLECYFL
jgi:hypothetical protein